MIITSLYHNRQRIKKDGNSTVYIRVTINREREYINMKFDWPASMIDSKTNTLLPRFKGDQEHSDNMIILNQELAKINEISRLARLANRELDLAEFKNQYYNYTSRESFTAYYKMKVDERFEKGIIRQSTHKTHLSSLSTLTKFKENVLFSDINRQFLEDFKAFMYTKLNYDSDTALTKLKNLRTYLNQAKSEEIVFQYPFGDKFKMPAEQRSINYLNEEEFKLFRKYFENNLIDKQTNKAKAARCYLFMCYSGMRISDFSNLSHASIKNEVIHYQPIKAQSDKQTTVEVPLHPYAKKLIITRKGKLFELPSSDTKMRQMLAEIADTLGISNTCNPHSARHTFATRFLRHGGRIEVLKELLGHENIKTTLIYVHVDLQRKIQEINFIP